MLAAGASTRMGEPKPLVRLGGRPLLAHILAIVRRAAVVQVVVVLGPEADRVRAEVPLGDATVVPNPRYAEGMSSSLRAGVAALGKEVGAFLVVLGDQPLVAPATLDRLIDRWRATGALILIPTFRGVRGNPVLLDRTLAAEVETVEGDQGCRALFPRHAGAILEVPVDDPGVLIDIDTPEELERVRRALEGEGPLEALAEAWFPRGAEAGPGHRGGAEIGAMAAPPDVLDLAQRLRGRREPFALATVVRAIPPTSGKPGYKALVLPTGELLGWVGGSCSRALVVKEALAALGEGRPRLVRFVPEPSPAPDEGVVEHVLECQSGGSVDIYIEPNLPKPQLLVVGDTPVAAALVALGRLLDYRVIVAAPGARPEAFPAADQVLADLEGLGAVAVGETYAVVATMQRYDGLALRALAPTAVRYLALVASRRRAQALLEALRAEGVPAAGLGQVRSPAGLDIAAQTPEEIALSVMAEITRVRRTSPSPVVPIPAPADRPIDVVCGMEVDPGGPLRATRGGVTYYFCSESCRARFLASPDAYGA